MFGGYSPLFKVDGLPLPLCRAMHFTPQSQRSELVTPLALSFALALTAISASATATSSCAPSIVSNNPEPTAFYIPTISGIYTDRVYSDTYKLGEQRVAYSFYSNTDLPAGCDYNNSFTVDMEPGFYAPSWQDCIEACNQANTGRDTVECEGISYLSWMCWRKKGVDEVTTYRAPAPGAVSAIIHLID